MSAPKGQLTERSLIRCRSWIMGCESTVRALNVEATTSNSDGSMLFRIRDTIRLRAPHARGPQ